MTRQELSSVEWGTGHTPSSLGLPGGMAARPVVAQGLRAIPGGGERLHSPELGKRPDPSLDQRLMLTLSRISPGEADLGECLDTARRVTPEDAASWTREWSRTAEWIRELAQQAESKGRWISAGEAWLRASTYYRAALHRHPEPQGPDAVRLARHALVGFTRSLRLLGLPAQPVFIPYEHTTLPGYFFRSPAARGPAPVLIVHPGRDAWAEDCKSLAEAALKRGYHCLLFEGPGQGKVLRLQGLPFRPDWEKVVTPVVDWVLSQRGVDPARLALVGLGMGESLAPRMALFERRLKLCTTHPSTCGWMDLVYEHLMNAKSDRLASIHSHAGTPSVGSQRLFDWLDERL